MWHSFFRDVKGSVATVFALGLVTLLGTAGTAVDFSNLLLAKVHAQADLDAAALAALSGDSADQANVIVHNMLPGNGYVWNAVTTARTTTSTTATVTVTGSATVRSMFLQLIGFNQLTASVASAATGYLSPIEITLSDYSGAGRSGKVMKIHATQADGSDLVVWSLSYTCQLNCGSLVSGVCTGGSGTPSGTTTSSPSDTVDLSNYTNIWMDMVVQDWCHTDVFTTYQSNDPSSYPDNPFNRLRVNGSWLQANQSWAVAQMFACGVSTNHSWEDTLSDFPSDEYITQDLFVTATATCGSDVAGQRWLSR